MFLKVSIPVVGVIENMSYFEDTETGKRSYIFGQKGAEEFAKQIGVPLLAEIPLNENLRLSGDGGKPMKDSGVFDKIAKDLVAIC
jgi:ATP-binding protein involved in chromosome partitioning